LLLLTGLYSLSLGTLLSKSTNALLFLLNRIKKGELLLLLHSERFCPLAFSGGQGLKLSRRLFHLLPH
jgi:hypothetical protein